MSNRIEKFAKKISGDVRKKLYDAQKEQMVKLETAYFRDHEKIQNQVKQIIGGVSSILHHYYMDFAMEIYSKQKKFSGQTLLNELTILNNKWEMRGLDSDLLLKIKRIYVPAYPIPAPPPAGNIWIVDKSDTEVYKYLMDGTYVSSFDTTGHGENNYGIATDGINIWTVDIYDQEVYKYLMDGTYVSSFDTTGHGESNYGIATDGINIWIVDVNDAEVYKYLMDGTYVSSFDTSAYGHSNFGITTDGINIWTVDQSDKKVYKYLMDGTYVSSFDTSAHGTNNYGITTNKRYL
ncbi:hypothetical protein ES705_36304 [subsurface metagenome]